MIDYEPAFTWWIKHVLKERDRIIASIKKQQTKHLKRSHKFGIELPTTKEQAYAMDAKNGHTLWTEQYTKKWRMSEWHLKSYHMGSQCL